MDLPTYTNIWRIEKRLYKLYDLRLPMPLPIVWIGVFMGVLVPWSLFLWLVGLDFVTPWHVVYLVPPGIVTWLSTRPVIESKRLNELLQSQLRYLGEPRTWCRMAPSAEPAEIVFHARVWRAAVLPEPVKVKATRKARHAAKARGRAQRATPAGQVRPAVAAAAAAATTAPVAPEAAPAVSGAREAPALGAGRTPRRGVAPALSPSPGTQVAPPDRASVALPSVAFRAPAQEPQAQGPQERAERPAAPPLRSGRGEEHLRVVPDRGEGPEEGPRESGGPADGSAGSAVSSPDSSAVAASVSPSVERREPAAPVAPIGADALRRLRRLAASVDGPGGGDRSSSSSYGGAGKAAYGGIGGGRQEATPETGESARDNHRRGQPPL
ncbi:TcpE family conjugal transfer membrane protein, partial [Spongiactinospora gelatinilytica]|uniref:TcpE family conjugal transfer membrane protein n=1 Tax=Spongiactinospora gelatinilytica TaxID=2666298 RepID=UPI002279A67F